MSELEELKRKIAEKKARIESLKEKDEEVKTPVRDSFTSKGSKSKTSKELKKKKLEEELAKLSVEDESDSDDEEIKKLKARIAAKKKENEVKGKLKAKPKKGRKDESDEDSEEISNSDSQEESEEEQAPKKKTAKKPLKKKFTKKKEPESDEDEESEEDKPKKKTVTKTKKSSTSKRDMDELEKLKEEVAKYKSMVETSDSIVRKEDEVKKKIEEKNKEIARLKEMSAASSTARVESDASVIAAKREKDRLLKSVSSSSMSASSMKSETTKLQDLARKKQFGLDLAIVMDCTGSMGSWIAQAKEHIRSIMKAALEIDPRVIPRISFVGYRDYGDTNRFDIVDFKEMDQSEDLKKTLDACVATGGGDGPEDVAGALNKVLGLTWNSSTRLLIHIADAPPHGNQYHNGGGDNYPSGDPEGLVIETLLGRLCDKSVDYYFCHIQSYTDKMEKVFAAEYAKRNKHFTVHNIGNNPAEFLPKVIQSITASMSASAAFK